MIFLTFFIGLIANFIGYIPPGNINLTVVQLTCSRGMKQVLSFIIAFSCAEFIFTYVIMNGANWLASQVHLETVVDWLMIGLFGILGTVTWINRKKAPKARKNAKGNSIAYGILLGFVNPVQIPFWLVAGSYVIAHNWIETGWWQLAVFSAGSASGAFLALFGYARSASYMQKKLDLSTRVINTGVAVLLYAFAAYHVGKELYIHVFKH